VNSINLLKVASAMMLLLAWIPRVSAQEKSSNPDALRTTIRAIRQTRVVGEVIRGKQEDLNHKVKKVSEELGHHKVTLAAVGVATQLAIQGKVSHRVRLGNRLQTEISVDKTGELATELQSKQRDGSIYSLVAYHEKSDSGVRMGVRLNFD